MRETQQLKIIFFSFDINVKKKISNIDYVYITYNILQLTTPHYDAARVEHTTFVLYNISILYIMNYDNNENIIV